MRRSDNHLKKIETRYRKLKKMVIINFIVRVIISRARLYSSKGLYTDFENESQNH